MSELHQLPTKETIPSPPYQILNELAEKRAKLCKRAPVPSLNHLTLKDYNFVYEPSEDTFLLLDALRYDFEKREDMKDELQRSSNNVVQDWSSVRVTLEIGCGTGVASIYLATLLQSYHSVSVSKENTLPCHYVTDVNPDAIRITCETAAANGVPQASIIPIVCDLATPLLQADLSSPVSLENSVDVLIFNPPYVPTPDEEVGRSTGLEASWAGGVNGRRIIDRVLPQIDSLLVGRWRKNMNDITELSSLPTSSLDSSCHTRNGVAYMIVVDDNMPEDIAVQMKNNYDISVIPWLRRKARNEYLTVLKMFRTHNHFR